MDIEEFVELDVAKTKFKAAIERLQQGDMTAEGECERWDRMLKAHPEYILEIEEEKKKWEAEQVEPNEQALREMRGYVPADISMLTLDAMTERGMPRALARRVRDKRALWLVRMHHEDIALIHHADLHNTFGPLGLDLIELRAVFAASPKNFPNDSTG